MSQPLQLAITLDVEQLLAGNGEYSSLRFSGSSEVKDAELGTFNILLCDHVVRTPFQVVHGGFAALRHETVSRQRRSAAPKGGAETPISCE